MRLSHIDTIEFGYDQPRLATQVQEYLRHGNFLNAQKFALESPWGNLSWGPILIWFFAPFIAFSTNPVSASILVSIFNLVSVLAIFVVGYKFFSLKVAIISSLFLAVHPWWIVFSRMIYQPTPVVSFVSISILITFLALKKKSKFIIFLAFLWGALIQLYLICFSFVFTSFWAVVISLKGISKRYFFIGIVLAGVIFVPSLIYYRNNNKFGSFFKSETKFEDKNMSIIQRSADVASHYFNFIGGGDFEYQLGYGYKKFSDINSQLLKLGLVMKFSICGALIYFAIKALKEKKSFNKLLLLAWAVAPVWFLILFKIPIVPRYFLISLPALALIFGITIDDIAKNGWVILFVFPFLILWFAGFSFSYFRFIENYTYPNGFLSHYSDIPYSFLDKSINFIDKDALGRGYFEYSLSNDAKRPFGFYFNWATAYVWREQLKRSEEYSDFEAHYLLIYSNEKPYPGFVKLNQFGPYIIYGVIDR